MSARDEAAGGVELLPCPSCKSRNLFCGPTAIGNPTLHVRCYQCGMEGPFAAWNRRSPSPRDQACSAMLGALETQAAKDVLAERDRQKSAEGWSLEHDDEHKTGDLAKAAACYALAASYDDFARDARRPNEKLTREWTNGRYTEIRSLWPWDWGWWKPKDRRRDLVRSGALILAEIERLDRAARSAGIEPVEGKVRT